MLRTLLAGILAVSAAAACGGREDAPAATPGAPVGKVVELAGSVTATRGTTMRTLTTGGEISTDDVIDTAADGRVVILLAHNNARWDLGPNRKSTVGESLAWNAPKQAGPAAVVREETSTAGRHAEKTAGTTGSTTGAPSEREEGADPSPGAEAAPTDEGAKQDPSAAPQKTSNNAKPRRPSINTPGTVPRPPKPPGEPSAFRGEDAKSEPRNEKAEFLGTRGAVTPRDTDDGGPDLQSKGGGEATRRDALIGGSTGDPERTDPLELEIRATLRKQSSALQVCLGTDLSRLVVRVSVTDGVYSILSTDPKAPQATRECLAKVARTLKATTAGKVSVSHAIAK